MGRAHVSTDRPVAGRFRPVEITHRETNRVRWYADDLRTGRPFLVTRIGLPPDAGDAVRRAPSRVLRTAGIVSRLCPERTATVVETAVEAGFLWIVTAWIDGTPLDDVLAGEGAFDPVRAARTGLDLLDVLDAAHAGGLTHGELSPGEVFLSPGGPLVVAGYGLTGTTPAPRLTAPSYAAPEQARGEPAGPAADLWALGAILYALCEGRAPFRDRGRFEATLRGVDRLPLRAPVRAGPLTPVVQGLLCKEARERPTGAAVREALARVVREDAGAAPTAGPDIRPRGGHSPVLLCAGREVSRRAVVLGAVPAAAGVAALVLAATRGLSGTATGTSSGPPPASASGPTGSGPPDSGRDEPEPGGRGAAPAPTGPPGPAGLPPGYRTLHAPEGFSVALPAGWQRLDTSGVSGLAYRVTFGADDDPRRLAVTYSERVGTDAVAVWRDDVEPLLRRAGGYRRIGGIRATTYRGREAADMEWFTAADGTRVRTFGRGFLLGGGRGFSLRWTTPADGWAEPGSREALRTFLRTFRP